MKVSVITACFNSEKTIAATVESVLSQNCPDIEYILIDGGSTDSTVPLVRRLCADRLDVKIVSEKDRGVYDAMNKGIAAATGDIVSFLNSDDFFVDGTVLQKVVDVFNGSKEVEGVYGDILYVDREHTDRNYRKWISGPQKRFVTGWHPAHPAFFVRRDVYIRYGCFNLDYRLAADFELMLRLSDVHGICLSYLPEILVKMRRGGMTNNSVRNILAQNRECIQAFRANAIPVNAAVYLVRRLFPKVLQFLR